MKNKLMTIVKGKLKGLLGILAFLLLLGGIYLSLLPSEKPTPQEMATQQLHSDPFSEPSVWDSDFLRQHTGIREKLRRFTNGSLCKSLKMLDTKALTHQEISKDLTDLGFACFVRPLSVDPKAHILKYLKVDGSITGNPKDPGIAQQEICFEQTQPDCVIRIKRDGFPRNRRTAPHSTKAVMIDSTGDPGSYDNEAFKITAGGQALPKGPSEKFGLRKCPYGTEKRQCEKWVDALMDEAHPLLKDPVKSPSSNPRP